MTRESTWLDRRQMLAATAIGLATAEMPARAQTRVAATATPVRIDAASARAIMAARTRSPWVSMKSALISSTRFAGWLASFDEMNSVDSIIFDALTSLTGDPPYDPYQLDSLFPAVSTLLDRCLIYRREMFDLEEQAVRRALEYKLFTDQHDAQKAIERADAIEQQRAREKTGQQEAANRFGHAKDNAVAHGLQAIAASTAASSGIAETAEQQRKRNIDIKWRALDEYQSALEARHSTPGHALNYAERYNRIKAFLSQDIKTAYSKIRCVEKAANKLFGLSVALQPPVQAGYLDYLVLFVRDVIEKIEIESQKEIDFDHVVYLHQPRWNKSTNAQVQRVGDTPWNDAIGNANTPGTLTFDLTANEFPATIGRLKMRGLAMTAAMDNPQDLAAKYRSFAVAIFPPMPEDLFSPGGRRERLPIILENVAVTDGVGPRLFAYDPIVNVDPRGEWHIQVSINAAFPDAALHRRNQDGNTQVTDLRLHLKLRAIADNRPGSWTDFSW